MNPLNLPEWNVLNVEEAKDGYHITAVPVVQRTSCPHCGNFTELVRNGTKAQTVMDIPYHAKPTGIHVRRQRYLCRKCGGTSLQPLPDVDEKRAMTVRLVNHLKEQSTKKTFAALARETGLSRRTVHNVFKEHARYLEEMARPQTPEWMGMDEVYLVRQYRFIVTDVRNRTLIEMLPNRRKATVYRYLRSLPDRDRVQLVTMDMWGPYRDAVRDLMPQAKIVVDKFHITKMANDVMERVRRDVRRGLTVRKRRLLMRDRFILLSRRGDLTMKELVYLHDWSQQFPVLGQAYEMKELFYDVWDSKSEPEAGERLMRWEVKLDDYPLLKPYFKELMTALVNWNHEIFNYFRYRATNAYTEAVNSLIKLANRTGRGYSFEVIRAKMLYSLGEFRADPTPKFQKAWGRGAKGAGMWVGEWHELPDLKENWINHGVFLSTLVEKIVCGEI